CAECGPSEICGNGKDDDCNGFADCSDTACKASPTCSCGPAEICDNGTDDDCNGFTDCSDTTCASTATCRCHLRREDCNNGSDDNCNGLVDCFDSQCVTDAACLCVPGTKEVCNDLKDNNCNGFVDCADPLCAADPLCKTCVTEICNNGKDDNCNLLVDCEDTQCVLDDACRVKVEVCDNFKDDNANGLTDCDDPSCFATTWCKTRHENCSTALTVTASGTYTGDTTTFSSHTTGSCGGASGEAVFRIVLTGPAHLIIDSSGTPMPPLDSTIYLRHGSCGAGFEEGCDDDSGSTRNAAMIDIPVAKAGTYYAFMDGFTFLDHGRYNFSITIDYGLKEICSNGGKDDDGNGYADCADKACSSASGCAGATPEIGVAKCTNGIDDDKDGKADCVDEDCHASKFYKTECCNGRDDNGNFIVDEDACHCAADTACDEPGYVCNLTSTESCSPRCDRIVGTSICPVLAPGTMCDASTGQCIWPGG
ncbi:MAG: hypothetical protein ABI175_17465, partial [Polyangiales bacterium]